MSAVKISANVRGVTPARLTTHIRDLATAGNIFPVFIPREDSERGAYPVSLPGWKLILTPVIQNSVDYGTALHELGHMFVWKFRDGVLHQEELAWRWARKHALIWTPAMEKDRRECLAGYRKHCHRRKK